MNDVACQALANHIDLACKTYGYTQQIIYDKAEQKLMLSLKRNGKIAIAFIEYEDLLHLDGDLIVSKLQERTVAAFNKAAATMIDS
jgi:hypothetical protein